MLQWQDLGDGYAFRAPAPAFGFIRVETFGGDEWFVNYAVPGYSNSLIDQRYPTAEAAKIAANASIRGACAAFLKSTETPAPIKGGSDAT